MKFSEIPHFIIKKFIDRSYFLQSEDAYEYEEGETLLNPDFVFQDRDGVYNWENTEDFTWSGVSLDTWINDSYLMGPRKSIVTYEEGIFLELYYKDKEGFHPIRIKVYSNTNQDEKFNFKHIHDLNYPSDLYETVSTEHYDEEGDSYLSYIFEVYDIWDNKIEIESSTSLYFRKDSVFHDWLVDNAPALLEEQYNISFIIDQYINVDKPFVYLGDVYKNSSKGSDEYFWLHYNINNFVVESIPEHQRTEKIVDFIYLAFNVLYNNIYQSQKNFWSAIDPIECDEELLNNISEYYDINLDRETFSSMSNKRMFIKYLHNILSSKGTYTGMYTIWKYITQSKNRLNLYERWHSKELSGYIDESDYVDWLYTSFYDSADFDSGAGIGWYDEYFNKPYPYYESTLSEYESEVASGYIGAYTNSLSSKDIITQFYTDEDIIYPNEIFIDQDYIYHSTVENTKIVITESDFEIRKEGSVWNISHGLNSDAVLIQIQDDSGYVFYSDDIEIVDSNNVKISFTENTEGNVKIRKMGNIGGTLEPNSYISNNTGSSFTISHSLNTSDLIVEVYDSDFKKIFPISISTIDNNNIEIIIDDSIETYTFIQQASVVETSSGSTSTSGGVSDGIEDTRNLQLSTQYIIEADLTEFPVESEKIISKETTDILFRFWEEFRPIHRTSKYQMIISPITDFTGQNVSLYDRQLIPYLNTKLLFVLGTVEKIESGAYIDYITNKKTHIVNHQLGSTRLLIDVYDRYFSKITFDEINYIKTLSENRVEVDFVSEKSFFVMVKKAEDFYLKSDYDDTVIIKHPHNTISIVTQSVLGGYIVEAEYIQLSGNDTIYYSPTEEIDNIWSFPSDFTSKTFEDTIWEIKHNLGNDAVIMEIYDEDNYKLHPDNIQIIDENNVEVSFQSSTKGRCEIVSVGNVGSSANSDCFISNNTSNNFTINHGLNQNTIIQIYDSSFNRIKPKNIQIVDDNNIEVWLEETFETYTFIRGTSTEVSGYDWVLNSLEFGWNFYNKTNRFYEDEYVKSPDTVKINDERQLLITGENINKTALHSIDYTDEISVASTEWNVNHLLDTLGLIIDTYDENWEKIYPSSIQIDDSNRCTITFDNAKKGHVLITKVGNPSVDLITDQLDSTVLYLSSIEETLGKYSFYDPTGGLPSTPENEDTYISSNTANGWVQYHIYKYDEESDSWIETVDNDSWIEEVNINRLREDSDFMYTEFKIDSSVEMNIREMLIVGDESLVYSECAEIHKPSNCEMNIFFRLSKSEIEE